MNISGIAIVAVGVIVGFGDEVADALGDKICPVESAAYYTVNGDRERVLVRRLSPTEILFTTAHDFRYFEFESILLCANTWRIRRVVGPIAATGLGQGITE